MPSLEIEAVADARRMQGYPAAGDACQRTALRLIAAAISRRVKRRADWAYAD
jgi:hypothetical protein